MESRSVSMSLSSADISSAEEGDDAPPVRPHRTRKAPERYVPDMTGLVDDFGKGDFNSSDDSSDQIAVPSDGKLFQS